MACACRITARACKASTRARSRAPQQRVVAAQPETTNRSAQFRSSASPSVDMGNPRLQSEHFGQIGRGSPSTGPTPPFCRRSPCRCDPPAGRLLWWGGGVRCSAGVNLASQNIHSRALLCSSANGRCSTA